MQLLDLPVELLHTILFHSIAVRGVARGVRLRLVNKVFSREVMETLYAFRLLDEHFGSLTGKDKPEDLLYLAASYLKYRVMNEPANGNRALICIRKVAEHLHQNRDPSNEEDAGVLALVDDLCNLIVQEYTPIFQTSSRPEDVFSNHLIAAAIYTNNLRIVQQHLAKDGYCIFTSYSWIFGHSMNLVARYGNREVLSLFLGDGQTGCYRSHRCSAFYAAAKYGRTADIVRYIFEFRAAQNPWRFDEPLSHDCRDQPLRRAMSTPSRDVWDYVMELWDIHGHRRRTRIFFSHLLEVCAQKGWTEMAKYMLHLGADPNTSIRSSDERVIIAASVLGHAEIVQALLEYNANSQGAMAGAAGSGHLAIVKLLLNHAADTIDALPNAIAGGYRDIVQTLLDNGVDWRNHDLDASICRAIKLEHTTLLRLLFKRGVGIPDAETYDKWIKRALDLGLESIVAFLHQHCQGVEEDECKKVSFLIPALCEVERANS